MNVCWFGHYDPMYARNSTLIEGLGQAGARIIQCKTNGNGPLKYIRLICELRKLNNQYDVIYCAFPAGYTVIIAWLFQSRPIVMDAFFPMREALVEDRKSLPPWHPKALIWKWVDFFSIKISSRVICDTQENAAYWQSLTGRTDNFYVVPVGANSKEFFVTSSNYNPVTVTFHGSYIPLQGVDVIVRAATILRDRSDIKWRFIGSGQLFGEIKDMIVQNGIDKNIEIIPWVPIAKLNEYINTSEIILGVFGSSNKTNRVVPNKLYQGLAVGKPVITKNTPAVRRLLDKDVYLVSEDISGQSLARAIVELVDNKSLRNQYASQGNSTYKRRFTELCLGKELYDILTKVISK